jgi:hypothetical protein
MTGVTFSLTQISPWLDVSKNAVSNKDLSIQQGLETGAATLG